MLSAVKIKEEPLDVIEGLQELLKQQEALIVEHNMDEIKNELHADTSHLNNFHIVDEQESIITVSAADMKSADELKFIQTLNNTNKKTFSGVCSKCLKMFTNRSYYLKHMRRNHCHSKQKCPICPVTFIENTSLLKHLKLHQENYFFCSQHCGANYETLPLCEDHELREHKVQNTPKIRLKHFCSFCREGFKTELQLHVHWLQQNQGCGKLMQDVVIHSNNVAGNNNNNYNCKNKNQNNAIDKQKKQSPNRNPVTTCIPITKLRLKACPAPLSTIKRPQDIDEPPQQDINTKRMKTFEKIKMDTESTELPFNFIPNIEIKEEPLDEEDQNMTTNLVPEVIIKTEDEATLKDLSSCNNADDDKTVKYLKSNNAITPIDMKPEMKSLFINNMMNPEFNGKIIPLSVHTAVPNKMPALKWMYNNSNAVNINNNNNINAANIINNNAANIINNNAVNINNLSNIPNTTNTSLKNVTNLKLIKLTPASIASTNLIGNNFKFTQLPNGNQPKLIPLKLTNAPPNGNLMPLPKTGLQILKFLPKTQLLTFKATNPNIQANSNNISSLLSFRPQNPQNLVNNNPTIGGVGKPPIIVKLQTAPTINSYYKPLFSQINPPPLAPAFLKNPLNQTMQINNDNIINPCTVSIKLNSLDHNTTIDADDLQKLQTEALIKSVGVGEQRKNCVIPKERLTIIENLPKNKQLIDSMKKQIAEVQTKSEQQYAASENSNNLSPSSANVLKMSPENFVLNEKNVPPSIYLPVLTAIDVELVQARYKYPQYNYKWICPYCLRDYEMKHGLKCHLSKAHNLSLRDMEKINVQAKPYKIEEDLRNHKLVIKAELIQPDETDSQSIISESDSMSADNSNLSSTSGTSPSGTSPDPIKMSALKAAKGPYICNKCGRKCSSKTMLKDHLLANCSREPQYACVQCPKKFFSHSTLQCHMTIHTGELPHKCNYCDKRFRTRGQVTVHHRTHTGERPFVCQVCAQRFTHRETLIAHLSRHIGMKRYKCYGCDKHFSCISALKTHRDLRADSCGKVKFNPRAIGPRVRVIRGNVVFEAQPEINPYLKSEDPKNVLSELQNQPEIQMQATTN